MCNLVQATNDRVLIAGPIAEDRFRLNNVLDLRDAIRSALVSTPGEQDALRGAIWTFVGTERHSGAPAGQVIMALLDLVNPARLPPTMQQARLRRVML